jgi:hypothetical protein
LGTSHRQGSSATRINTPVASHAVDSRADMSPTCHPHATHMPPTCHPHVTHMPPTCHPHATHMPPTCHPHATHMSPTCSATDVQQKTQLHTA